MDARSMAAAPEGCKMPYAPPGRKTLAARRGDRGMATTKIEWTRGDDGTAGMTWNPVRGCTLISPGGARRYAQTFAERFRGVPGHPYEQGFDLRLVPEKLHDPLTWKKPKRVFVNSMSDLFHEGVPDEYVRRVVDVMVTADWHTYQVLTKRSERM